MQKHLLGSLPLRIVVQLLASFAVCAFAVQTIRWSTRVTHGFAMYYTYSTMVLHGDDFGSAFNDEIFNRKMKEYGINGVVDKANNPPTASLMMLPFATLKPATAKAGWSALSFVLLALSLLILLRLYEVDLRSTLGGFLIILCFLWHPLYENIAFGQVYILLLFLFVLGLYGIKTRSPVLTALTVASAFVLKGYGILVMVWLGLSRMKKTLLLAGCSIVAVCALSVLIFPLRVWNNYWQTGFMNLIASPSNAHVAYQTVTGFISHCFSYDQQWAPHPVLQLAQGSLRVIIVTVNLSLIAWVISRRKENGDGKKLLLAYSAAVAVGVLTAPVAEEYHYTLFLPLVIGLAVNFSEEIRQTHRLTVASVAFICAVLLTAAPIHYKILQEASFPLLVFAYPKLYGGLGILWYYKHVAGGSLGPN